MMDAYRDLILDAGDVEERLDLLPQLPPGPGAELQVLAQVALDNLESDSLEKNIVMKCRALPNMPLCQSVNVMYMYLCSCSFLYSLRDR